VLMHVNNMESKNLIIVAWV